MAEHVPVLLDAVVAAFDRDLAGAPVVDGTCGLGGHSAALLARIPGLQVVALDRDRTAVEHASVRLREFGDRAVVLHAEFGGWARELAGLGLGHAAGLLLDLGVSSPQLDRAERGFSFSRDGPLDMRMGQHGPTALDWLRAHSEAEIADAIFAFGEERLSRRIARGIVEALREDRLHTTGDLAAICRRAYPRGHQRIDPATRTFQAIRIAVNDELGELERALDACPGHLLAPAVVAIISFHSLEDRVVKQRFRAWQAEGRGRILKPDPRTADEAEVARNPRARSAKLRVFLWGKAGEPADPRDRYRSKKHRT